MDAISALPTVCGLIAASCAALGLSRATLHRRHDSRQNSLAPFVRALGPPGAGRLNAKPFWICCVTAIRRSRPVKSTPAARRGRLSVLNSHHVPDLHEHDEMRERRRQLRHPVYQKPELLAEGPNQVWSWDISKLMGPEKWSYFYLYVIIDIFSRRIVGWYVADAETAALFKPLFEDAAPSMTFRPAN